MYLCSRDIHLYSFYDFQLDFGICSDIMVFLNRSNRESKCQTEESQTPDWTPRYRNNTSFSWRNTHDCIFCRTNQRHNYLLKMKHSLQELLTLPEHLSSPQVFSGVRVTRSLLLCVCFVYYTITALCVGKHPDLPT